MGYRHQSKTFRLAFEDMPGLEVVMRSVPVGKLMDMAGLADDFGNGKASTGQVSDLFTMFADQLVSWNLEDDAGQPVPADLAGVRGLDTDMVMAIFEGWFGELTQAPPPLPKPSAPGPDPLMASLPMEPLPPNPES